MSYGAVAIGVEDDEMVPDNSVSYKGWDWPKRVRRCEWIFPVKSWARGRQHSGDASLVFFLDRNKELIVERELVREEGKRLAREVRED